MPPRSELAERLKRFESSAGILAIILAIYNLLLIASRILINKIYTDAMPQDLLAFMDCIYRVHLGQVVHRDFSSILGPFNFMLPATFMSMNAGLISSVNYSEAVYVVIAFFIYLYIQLTRLDRIAGFFLGVWIPLALLARKNFGDPLGPVTEAMAYNRRCDVFLLLLLLLFIPAREPNRTRLIVDGMVYGAISAFLFYSKITFGLVALGLAPIMLIRKRDNIAIIAVAAIIFLAIAAWVEIVHGTRFAWMNDVKMASASYTWERGNRTLGRMPHVLRGNLPELFGLLVIPAFLLMLLRKLTIPLAVFCVYVGAVSVFIVSYSAQSYLLTLPIAFVFVTLDALKPELAFAGSINQIQTRYLFLSVLASAILVIESYPLAVNIATSTYRAIHAPPWDSTNEVLKNIVTDLARPKFNWDNLTMSQYADYLHSGIAAARQGCENRARISTIDVLNSFPMLLGWPTGGGMFYAATGYLMSKKAHLPDDVMFRDINCVMIPKLPVSTGDRDALLDIYGRFLSKSFEQSFESDMWTVFRRRP